MNLLIIKSNLWSCFLFLEVMQDQKGTSFVEALNHNYGRPHDESKYPYILLPNTIPLLHSCYWYFTILYWKFEYLFLWITGDQNSEGQHKRRSSSTSERDIIMSSSKTSSIDTKGIFWTHDLWINGYSKKNIFSPCTNYM